MLAIDVLRVCPSDLLGQQPRAQITGLLLRNLDQVTILDICSNEYGFPNIVT